MGDAAARQVLVGRYEIVGVLGRGGMGTVYRGLDLELGRPVAVKLLSARLSTEAAALARFRREARSAARLNHPNVVSVYDSGVDHGEHYIIMELVPGGSLKELMRERGQLPLPLALALEDDILGALGAAHEAGLVHRDVSPSNIMVTRDGSAKVTDFGVARAFGPDAEQTGSIAGTAAYLAPEQAAGETATPAADLYGAGCVLHAMLTGQPPFGGGNAVSIAARHQDERPAAPSALRAGLPPAVDALVLRALEKRPEDRFATAADMRRALSGAGVALPPPGSRDAWPHGPGAAEQQTAVTRVDFRADRGGTAVWPAAPAPAARPGQGPRYRASAAPRPAPPVRTPSRALVAVIGALIIGVAVLILLAVTGVLSSASPATDTTAPRAPVNATPRATTPATSAPGTTAPETTAPETTAPTVTPPAVAPGSGGNPGKGPQKSTPGKGKKKGQ